MIVSLLGALSALALTLALSGSARAQPTGGPFQLTPVPWGAPQMQGALWYKRQMFLDGTPVGPGRNVAVYWGEYNGREFAVAAQSMPFVQDGHAEEQIEQALKALGIPRSAVEYGYSDLEPCTLISTDCMALVRSLPSLKEFFYNKAYPPYSRSLSPATNARNWVTRRLSVMELKEQNLRLEQTWTRVQDTLNPGCAAGEGGDADQDGLDLGALRARRVASRTALTEVGTGCGPIGDEGPEDGALPDELGDPAEALDPGGIDFTSLQLRYLSLSGPHQDELHYSMDSDGAPVTTNPGTGLQTAQQDSDAFFTWLTLPPSTFWVNLSPNTPPQIIDPRLALTNAGQVMLQSDLLLKEAIAPAENPATPDGAQFTQGAADLPAPTPADEDLCVAYRVWIVPGVATVHATKTQLYILNAPLNVKLAPVTSLPGQLLHPICPQDAYTTGIEALMRQWILPQLVQEVNTAPQWEPLRRIYMSRVAAQWVRQEAGPDTVMGRLVDSGLHRTWIARPAWSPTAIWDQYLQVYGTPTQYTAPVQINGVTVNFSFTAYGGVDFEKKIRERNTSNRQFKSHWRGLATAAKRSITRPSRAGDTTLVGGEIKLGATAHRSKHLKLPAVVRVPRRFIPPIPRAS